MTEPIYPGTFSPPTFGHLHILMKALEMFPRIAVICSDNPDKKNNLFTPEECKKLWQTYDLPAYVAVYTLEEFVRTGVDLKKVIMIRGFRGEEDLDYERKVLLANFKNFGLDKFLYIACDKEFRDISSSRARELAGKMELEKLSKYLSPQAITALAERMRKKPLKRRK